ncbi:type II toxin-antitoxin system death-on-curing family toxin [Saccharolobus caldissimus]|uniref:Death-on-curing protein n=1 Tax=Saccharolobus caldissimus TaxID=1702097 RepID=A0AAQ4CNU4_9CREN|nr:type II toxin-antitoxin system death-on-curing family toxin [Saccharolobus caldissimus]BDB97475.1 death-on-curing protein [Saccharolobus caldissimus]
MSILLEETLLKILRLILREFEAWNIGESKEKPLIIKIHDKVIASNAESEQGIINSDNIGIAIYSAIEDLNQYHDVSRSLAVLIYHLIVSHPFVDGNKRTALGLLLHILHEVCNDIITIPPALMELLLKTLAEVADYSPEEDEYAINKIREIIMQIIRD